MGDPIDLAGSKQNVFVGNGLIVNGLIVNGLIVNGLIVNGLEYNALGVGATGFDGTNYNGLNHTDLVANDVWQTWMTSTEFIQQEQVFEYIVRCALDSSQTIDAIEIDGQLFGPWQGLLGMAPDWHTSGNDRQTNVEQERVSACLLALVNHTGESVEISMRSVALDPPLQTEMAAYSQFEGQFFGNLFGATQSLGACRATDEPNMATDQQLQLANRLCALDPDGCQFKDWGKCATVCSGFDTVQGAYSGCTTADYPTVATFVQAN